MKIIPFKIICLLSVFLLTGMLSVVLSACNGDCDHVFDSYTIVEPTCTEFGSKTGKCTRCNEVVTVETYVPIGHTVLQGKCSRCSTNQENFAVAVIRDGRNDIELAKGYLQTANDKTLSAIRTLSDDYFAQMEFDEDWKDAMKKIEKAVEIATAGKEIWETIDACESIAAKYNSVIEIYDTYVNSDAYKTWKSYDGNYYAYQAYSARRNPDLKKLCFYTLDMESDLIDIADIFEEMESSDDFLSENSIDRCLIAYQGTFRIESSSDFKISFDSFNPNAQKTTYIIKVTDGKHSYEKIARDVTGTGSVTIKNCELTPGASVTMTFYTEDMEAVRSFMLLAKDKGE